MTGHEVRLVRRPRMARIVAYLARKAAEIEALEFGRVSFDLYGDEIKGRIEQTEKLPPDDG